MALSLNLPCDALGRLVLFLFSYFAGNWILYIPSLNLLCWAGS